MSKGIIILIVAILVIAVLVAGYFVFLKDKGVEDIKINQSQNINGEVNKNTGVVEPPKENCEDRTGSVKQACLDRVIKQEAIASTNINKCLTIDDFFIKNACIYEVLGNNYGIEECSRINDNDAKLKCENNYWQGQAQEKGDASLCDNMPLESFQEGCKSEILDNEPVDF